VLERKNNWEGINAKELGRDLKGIIWGRDWRGIGKVLGRHSKRASEGIGKQSGKHRKASVRHREGIGKASESIGKASGKPEDPYTNKV
jgi:hypothetical protein